MPEIKSISSNKINATCKTKKYIQFLAFFSLLLSLVFLSYSNTVDVQCTHVYSGYQLNYIKITGLSCSRHR